MPKGVMEAIMASSVSEESSSINMLFDPKNFQRLKMISEVSPQLIYAFTLLGLLQKRYKSGLLKDFITEFLSFQKSRDRQGVVELVEVMLGIRKLGEGDTE